MRVDGRRSSIQCVWPHGNVRTLRSAHCWERGRPCSRGRGRAQVRRVLRLLERPFDDDAAERLAAEEFEAAAAAGGAACVRLPAYDGPVPGQYKALCVSCSS